MPTTARISKRNGAPTADKIREYILGDEQLQMTEKGHARRLTTIEAIERALDTEEARRIRVIEDDAERAWAEHFMLAVLRPRFSDGLASSPTYSSS